MTLPALIIGRVLLARRVCLLETAMVSYLFVVEMNIRYTRTPGPTWCYSFIPGIFYSYQVRFIMIISQSVFFFRFQ